MMPPWVEQLLNILGILRRGDLCARSCALGGTQSRQPKTTLFQTLYHEIEGYILPLKARKRHCLQILGPPTTERVERPFEMHKCQSSSLRHCFQTDGPSLTMTLLIELALTKGQG